MATEKSKYICEEFSNLFGKLLTELDLADVKKLLTFFDMAEKESEINSTLDFLVILSNSGKFSSDNVSDLLTALQKSDLKPAERCVETYLQKTSIEPPLQLKETHTCDVDSLMCDEHQLPLEIFCNSCNVQICYGCAFNQHEQDKHKIVTKENIEYEIEACKLDIKEKIQTLETIATNVSKASLPLPDDDIFARKYEEAEERQYELRLNQLASMEEDLNFTVENLKRKEESKNEKRNKTLQTCAQTLNGIKEGIQDLNESKLRKTSKLMQLFNWQKKIADITEDIEAENKERQHFDPIYFSATQISPLGVSVEFHLGSVVGAISVSEKAAVIVKDERHHSSCVSLSCVSSENSSLFWTHENDQMNNDYPIIISGHLFTTIGTHSKILIAAGALLLILTIAKEEYICSISDIATKSLPIPENSFATALSPITTGMQDTGVLVAHKTANSLIRLDMNFEHFDTIACCESILSISSIACNDSKIAIVDSVRNEAIVIDEDERINHCFKLKVPKSTTVEMRPKFIQWDGSFWSILWESSSETTEKGRQWQHALYKLNGIYDATPMSGSCSIPTEVVSVSFIRNQSLICFSDGKVQTFPTNRNPLSSKLLEDIKMLL